MRDAVEEIGGAVQGIDHETRLGGIAFDLAALLHDETPVGAGARQFLEQRLLGALIRHRDEIGRPLAADLEVLDLVEITPQPRRRLACGTIHDGDEARMRYHRVSGRWTRPRARPPAWQDRKSTRLNSSH